MFYCSNTVISLAGSIKHLSIYLSICAADWGGAQIEAEVDDTINFYRWTFTII